MGCDKMRPQQQLLGFLMVVKGTPILMGETCHRLNTHGMGKFECLCRSAEIESDAGGSRDIQATQPHALIQGGKKSLL